ncbi:MAG: ParB/RepB/Spo0J family partition protein [Pseudomonadota bacterium]
MTVSSTISTQPLGRGLSALLGPESDPDVHIISVPQNETGAYEVPTHTIRAGSQQPRTLFNEAELADLTASIKEVGIVQPIVVRPISGKGEGSEYEIIAGERRWRAAKRLNLSQVPVVIREFTDEAALEVGLIENLQRHDLSPMEEAEGFQQLINKFSCTQETLSQRLGKSRSYIANTLRLLNLPEGLKDHVRAGRLSAGHARVLLSTDNPEELAEEILRNHLNVRDAEKRLKTQKSNKAPVHQRQEDSKDTEILGLEQMLTSTLEAPVKVQVKGDKAVLIITCPSLRKLDDVIEKITKEG